VTVFSSLRRTIILAVVTLHCRLVCDWQSCTRLRVVPSVGPISSTQLTRPTKRPTQPNPTQPTTQSNSIQQEQTFAHKENLVTLFHSNIMTFSKTSVNKHDNFVSNIPSVPLENFSTHDPTQPTKILEKYLRNPMQPNPTRWSTQPVDNAAHLAQK